MGTLAEMADRQSRFPVFQYRDELPGIERLTTLGSCHSAQPMNEYGTYPAFNSITSGAPVLKVRLEGKITPMVFLVPSTKHNGMADIAIKIDIGLLDDTDVIKLRHRNTPNR